MSTCNFRIVNYSYPEAQEPLNVHALYGFSSFPVFIHHSSLSSRLLASVMAEKHGSKHLTGKTYERVTPGTMSSPEEERVQLTKLV